MAKKHAAPKIRAGANEKHDIRLQIVALWLVPAYGLLNVTRVSAQNVKFS